MVPIIKRQQLSEMSQEANETATKPQNQSLIPETHRVAKN